MKFLIIILKIMILSPLIVEANNCQEAFNAIKCRYDVVCDNYLINFRWEDFITQDRYNRFPRTRNNDCYYENIVRIEGNEVDAINLVINSKTFDQIPVPSIENSQYGYNSKLNLEAINRLDLSNNEYHHMPIINSLRNLQELDVSNNNLRTANLSNEFELGSLIKIDLSHNTISEISAHIDKYPYRTLKEINLSNNYLVLIPEAIFDEFDYLQSLNISNNYIDTLNQITFEGIKKLINLDLSNNRITGINSSLFRFTELILLDLSYNRINQVNSVDFEKIFSVKELRLDHNLLTTINKNSFENLNHLTTLTLNDNKLLALDKDIFLNNIALSTLDISENKLNMLPSNVFKNNHEITFFKIYGNYLSGTLPRGNFEGLKRLEKLDLRNQNISTIDDLAFLGLDKVTTILLSHNKIRSLSKKSFNNLKELNTLDLSNNKIQSINFEKDDLIKLQSLSLRNNKLYQVNNEQFIGLNSLQFLDISNNNITQLDSNSFHSLGNLIEFQISNNPLSSILVENTFEGLMSLPTLDISHTLITAIHNDTFKGMSDLKDLNVSHSKLKELQYNGLAHIVAVEKIDISYNFLTIFDVNTTGLSNLESLFLTNNLIKSITSHSFLGLYRITEIDLAHNDLEVIENDAFKDQKYLRILNLSHNVKLKFLGSLFKTAKHLQNLILTEIDSDLSFSEIGDTHITKIDLSKLKVVDLSRLQLKELKRLNDLLLSHNEITKLVVGDFVNITDLRHIDLSYNTITFIQPGTFVDNRRLEELNLSHNSLAALTYGIFQGLNYLTQLDVSYNFINSLETERFYELNSLNILIADHNSISLIDTEEFVGSRLSVLSIGGNPLSCEVLVKFKKQGADIKITAIDLYENNSENVDGVSCNVNHHKSKPTSRTNDRNEDIIIDIRNILLNISNNKANNKYKDVLTDDAVNLTNMTILIANSLNDIKKIRDLETAINITTNNIKNTISDDILTQSKDSNETNLLLSKILNVLNTRNSKITTPAPIVKENATFENILPYINKINVLADTIDQYKHNVTVNLMDLSNKISHLDSLLQTTTGSPTNEKLTSTNEPESKSIFTEICVSLILLILISFVLFQVYKSKIWFRNRWSMSTNRLPDAMENSNL